MIQTTYQVAQNVGIQFHKSRKHQNISCCPRWTKYIFKNTDPSIKGYHQSSSARVEIASLNECMQKRKTF